ncbi:MAG: BON domain-containing protein [Desulfovibrio sp.]|jgi:hyperosmotically inducible protein
MRHVLLILILGLVPLSGCGTPAMPVIQAAGVAKTAYDYSDVVMPRSRVDFLGASAEDRQIENEATRRLRDQKVRFISVAPFAMDGHLYLVGIFADRKQAEQARRIARQIPGVRRLTCSFFRPAPQGGPALSDRELARRITDQLDSEQSLAAEHIRVGVLQRNAVIMGHVSSPEQKLRLENLLRRVQGLEEIRSYVAVRG